MRLGQGMGTDQPAGMFVWCDYLVYVILQPPDPQRIVRMASGLHLMRLNHLAAVPARRTGDGPIHRGRKDPPWRIDLWRCGGTTRAVYPCVMADHMAGRRTD